VSGHPPGHIARMKYTLLLAALVACASSQAPARQDAPAARGFLNIVVANQQSASASLLTSDGARAKHISVGNGPHEAAISDDGSIAVVTVYGAQVAGNQLAVIDLARDSVLRTIDLGIYTRPHGAVFLSDSPHRIAVTSESTRFVVIVNVDDGTIESAIPTNARASHMIAVPADKERGFTANIADNSVSEVDLSAKTFVRTFAVPPRPEGIAVTPDGSEVWVGSNQTGAVTVISTKTGQITHTITGAAFPYRLGASPDGKTMAIVDATANKVHFADVPSHSITGTVSLPEPRGVIIGPDNRTAYVTLGGGSLEIIDIANLSVIRSIPVQASPDGVAVGIRK
jgi:YVTN family beta-propeller protein